MQNDSDTLYFHVTGGLVMAAIEKYRQRYRDCFRAQKGFVDEFGGDGLAIQGDRRAIIFRDPSKVPAGWIRANDDDAWWPRKNSTAGKAFHRCAGEVPVMKARSFQTDVIGPKDHFFYFVDGTSPRSMGWEKHADSYVLLVPNTSRRPCAIEGANEGAKWTPPDAFCTPMKVSEYWRLKELNALHPVS